MTLSLSKLVILPAASLMLAVPSLTFAQTDTSLSGLYACEAISGQQAQLSCFLTETAKLRAAETVGTSNPIVTESAPISAPKPAAPEFAPLPKKEAKAPKTRTLAIISAQAAGSKGYTRFTLENGEVWQQIESARVRLGKEQPDTLTLKRASFGSFIGRVNDKRPSFRVRRIK